MDRLSAHFNDRMVEGAWQKEPAVRRGYGAGQGRAGTSALVTAGE